MVKLTERQLANLGEYRPETNMTAALALAQEGWNVFPLRPGTKEPLISKKQGGKGAHDGTTDPDQIRKWWTRNPKAGIGANLGDDRIAFDIDTYHGGSRLSSFPDTRIHHTGRGQGSIHLIYRIDSGSAASLVKSGTNVLGPGIDIRTGRGSYIVMPPTLHEETGKPYLVDKVHRHEHTLTDDELQSIFDEAGKQLSARARGRSRGIGAVGTPRDSSEPSEVAGNTLSSLLEHPPQEGGRNDWLARVCGHLAKTYTNRNEYSRAVTAANLRLDDPLDQEEVDKTSESVWNAEQAKTREACADSGWLTGNKRALFCRTAHREGEELVFDQGVYADFDIEARGVAVDELNRRFYWVRLFWKGQTLDTTLAAEILGHDQQTRSWLAARGLSIDPPNDANPKTAPATRILRYLNWQTPPQVHIITTLGWADEVEGFVTHDGVITPDGFQTKEAAGVVADPRLIERDVAPYTYGFNRDADEARRVLKEVLTFQDQTVTSVFGAWWAATLLKPQIQDRTAIFPFFGVEAASESGKTNGFFDLMVALNGNTRGQIVPTKPVLRDYASANKSGIVWADDLDNLDPYGELLRASTSNGTASKMDIDRSGIKNTHVVSPILITGESLGFGTQKALVDRSILMGVSSPKDRMSTHDPDRPQWQDVLDLKEQYPESQGGLSVLAGHYVKEALAALPQVQRVLRESKRKETGRHADKMSVLRAGARLLDHLLGHDGAWEGNGEHARRVESWITANAQQLDQDNTLTTKILPWAMSTLGMPSAPEAAPEMGRWTGIASPVFVKGDLESTDTLEGFSGVEVWYSPTLLAMAWARDKNHRVEARTETEEALIQQAAAIGGDRKSVKISGSRTTTKYRRLPDNYAAIVLQRSMGR